METRGKRYEPVKAYKDQDGRLFSTPQEAEDSDLFARTLKDDASGMYLTTLTLKSCIKVCRKYFTEELPQRQREELTTKYVKLLKEIRDQEAETGDTEVAHGNADDTLISLLLDLGFKEVVDSYDDIPKWYA